MLEEKDIYCLVNEYGEIIACYTSLQLAKKYGAQFLSNDIEYIVEETQWLNAKTREILLDIREVSLYKPVN